MKEWLGSYTDIFVGKRAERVVTLNCPNWICTTWDQEGRLTKSSAIEATLSSENTSVPRTTLASDTMHPSKAALTSALKFPSDWKRPLGLDEDTSGQRSRTAEPQLMTQNREQEDSIVELEGRNQERTARNAELQQVNHSLMKRHNNDITLSVEPPAGPAVNF
jgi:hypothetical protein